MNASALEIPVWSKSRAGAFNECRRKFFLTTEAAPSESIDRLKKIKNRYLWAGAAVHETIGEILKGIRQGQSVPAADDVVGKLRESMRDDFRVSKSAGSGRVRLFEHEYSTGVSNAVWQDQWNGVEKSLRWFLGSAWPRKFSALGPECWKAVDEVVSFELEGVKAYVKLDCAVEIGGRFLIVDWKTSALKATDAEPLLVAALYAHEVWGAEPESIDAMTVSLLQGRESRTAVDNDALMDTVLRIQDEAVAMEENLKTLGTDPWVIPMTDRLETCLRCNFQGLCHPKGVPVAI